jgi:predicted CopG family antitoxin
MARQGYKTITMSEEIHTELKKRADEGHRTISKEIEYLLDQEKVCAGTEA